MYRLEKGNLRTVIYNKNDLDLYKQSGWTLIEDEKKEEVKSKKDEVDEQSNNKRKSIKR
jgi:hypothetical protein